MNRAPVNLADPDQEPTDEDFARLMRDAFAGIREAQEASLVEMRARIARMQKEVLARYVGVARTTQG
jgi:hypothetical protein